MPGSLGISRASAYSITARNGLIGGIPVLWYGGTSNVMWIAAGIGVVTLVLYKENKE